MCQKWTIAAVRLSRLTARVRFWAAAPSSSGPPNVPDTPDTRHTRLRPRHSAREAQWQSKHRPVCAVLAHRNHVSKPVPLVRSGRSPATGFVTRPRDPRQHRWPGSEPLPPSLVLGPVGLDTRHIARCTATAPALDPEPSRRRAVAPRRSASSHARLPLPERRAPHCTVLEPGAAAGRTSTRPRASTRHQARTCHHPYPPSSPDVPATSPHVLHVS